MHSLHFHWGSSPVADDRERAEPQRKSGPLAPGMGPQLDGALCILFTAPTSEIFLFPVEGQSQGSERSHTGPWGQPNRYESVSFYVLGAKEPRREVGIGQ